jgi:hypothetical protein
MTEPEKTNWRKLYDAIAKENDSKKFARSVEELLHAFDEDKRIRLSPRPPHDEKSPMTERSGSGSH